MTETQTQVSSSESTDEPPLHLNYLFSQLCERFHLSEKRIAEILHVVATYPMQLNEYYINLIQGVDDPIWKQCIPDMHEIQDQTGDEDPLCEERDAPAPLITHRYPDRVLMLISESCAMYCRFCTRKRKVGTERLEITYEKIDRALEYITAHTNIRDVILSGGDALCAPIERIEYILSRLCEIPHIELIRFGTRLPCVDPKRITKNMCERLAHFLEYKSIFINVHFEHPRELTTEAKTACIMLANHGFPLGNQNVLLRDVNDDPKTMGDLWKGLLRFRVKPYYLFQADYVRGTEHFRTHPQVGLDIIEHTQGFTSGFATPHFVIDAPGGGGKIPLLPQKYVQSITAEKVLLKNYKNQICEYPLPVKK